MSFPVMVTSFRMSESGSQAGEKKSGYVNYEVEPGFTIRLRRNIDPDMDPKKLKRIISNRVAAQKSRWKKLQYANDLLKRSMELERLASVLRSQVRMVSEQKRCLESEKRELKECISAHIQRSISSQGEIEAYKVEIERLRRKVHDSLFNLT